VVPTEPKPVSKRKKAKRVIQPLTEKTQTKAGKPGVEAPGPLPELKQMSIQRKTDEWTTVRRNGKKCKKEKGVVPKEVKILLEETQKARGKKYGGYILRMSKAGGEGSVNTEVVEVTEADLIKNLWNELSKKKCAPKLKRLKKVGRDKLYVEPENADTIKLLQNASFDLLREKSSYNNLRGRDRSRGRWCRRSVGEAE